jgi:hypothetical protein
MDYNQYDRNQLKDILKQRFYRKTYERGARDIRYNKTNEAMREDLRQADIRPPVSDKVFKQLREREDRRRIEQWDNERRLRIEQQEKRRTLNEALLKQTEINNLIKSLPLDPVNSFNRLQKLKYEFKEKDIETLFRNVDSKYIVKVKFYNIPDAQFTLTRENVKRLKSMIIHKIHLSLENVYGSDTLSSYNNEPIEEFEIIRLQPRNNVRQHNGFFPYRNNTTIDLTKYQMYNQYDDLKEDEEDECCVIKTLINAGITEDVIKQVIVELGTLQTNVPLSKMESIAQVIKKQIHLIYQDEKHNRVRLGNARKYGKEYSDVVQMAQYKNHIFTYDITKYTAFYIKNKNELDEKYEDDEKRFSMTSRYGKYFKSSNPIYISSLELVVLMMEHGHFSDYHVDMNRVSGNYKMMASLCNIEAQQKNFIDKEYGDGDALHLFADSEADVSGKYHKMIAFGISDMKGSYKYVTYPSSEYENRDELFKMRLQDMIIDIINENGVKIEERKLTKKVHVWIHNLKYDAKLLDDILKPIKEVSKDGQLYSKTYNLGRYQYDIECRDSYKHFGGKLKDASTTFNLDVSKGEAIAYKYHTMDNISCNDLIPVARYAKYLKDEDKEIFKTLVTDKKFNPTAYYLEYLEQDVRVLRLSMLKYRELIKKITDLDAFNFLTISSIGYAYAVNTGCFTGLYETEGNLREFIQQSVKGGRVYVNPIYKNTIVDDEIEDFDGVSLYPSSMKRLCEEYGLPIGKIQKGIENTYAYYESKSWYIVKVRVTAIKKKIQVPCVSIHAEDGSLQYVNEIINPVELIVDKTTLNDYITFQDIDYEIIEGIYWDNGFNKTIGEVIYNLHIERCKHKQNNKPLATMIKLIMNSIYGKTGLRISDTSVEYIANDKKDDYIYRHFGVIDEINENKFNTRIVKRICDNSFNLNYVASSILSMSKRIMNEVFSVMDDNKQDVFYTDTDSIHMRKCDVIQLGKQYNIKYERELIGKDLGQFHTDFDMEGCNNVYSIKHIPIATKTYLDILQGTDKKGDTKQDVHIRIKGITKSGIDYELNRRGANRIESAISLFTDLKDGKSVMFYLNPTEHDVSFEFNSNGISTRPVQSFVRSLNDV